MNRTEGGGVRAKQGDTVYCHYTGRLVSNGQKFDSSRDKGRPFSFKVGCGQVIQGWDIIMLEHLGLGDSGTFRLDSSVGYGARGAGGVIPPNADLVFDVELLAIN